MEITRMVNYRVEKRLFRVQIGEIKEDLNYSESFIQEIDRKLLHPSYKIKLSKAPEFFTKEAKSKLSIQIEKFLLMQKNNPEVSNQVSSLRTNINFNKRNQSEKLFRSKDKRNRRSKNFLCSSACIIG